MVHLAATGADTLDQYIAKLQTLRAKYGGNCPVLTSGGDYPEGASSPHYITADNSNGYTPEGCIVLD